MIARGGSDQSSGGVGAGLETGPAGFPDGLDPGWDRKKMAMTLVA